MNILSGFKKDIEDGIKQGVDVVKSTASMVKEKAEELTEKGKTQYRIYELKNKGQKQRQMLGEKLRELVKAKKIKIANPDLTKLLLAVEKTDEAIAKLEVKEEAASPKKIPPKPTKTKKQAAKPKKAAPKAAADKVSKA